MPTSSQTAALIARYALDPGVGVGPLRFGDPISEHPQLELRESNRRQLGLELGHDFGDNRYYESDREYDDVDDDDDDDDGDEYAEYSIPGLDEFMIIYVDSDDCIDSVGFYEICLVEGRDLIGMGVGELLVRLGLPSTIEADPLESGAGSGVESGADILYGYERLGLTLWTIDGEVCVVHAGLAEA